MKFQRLTTESAIRAHIDARNATPNPTVVDLETTGLNPRTDRILDVVMTGGQDDEAISFSGELVQNVARLTCPLVFHNFKFDVQMLYFAGVDLRGRHIRDTMLMHHLVDEEASHGLDSIVQAMFQDKYKEVFWSAYDRYEDAPEDARLEYACKDVVYTLRLFAHLDSVLRARAGGLGLVEHVHRLALSLLDTEIRGVAVDVPYLMETGTRIQGQIEALRPQLRAAAPAQVELIEMSLWEKEINKFKTEKKRQSIEKPEFSFDSSAQLKDLLYTRLGLPVQYDQTTRKPTTGDDALVALESAHPIIPLLREYRGHQKVYGSYIEGTIERMVDGRIYPEFNVNGTKTGRISHSNPNLGQLPATGGIRGIYISDPGYVFISADYAQLEVVLAAHFSQDANLLKVVLEGASLHDITAEALGIPRPQAKTLNFALQFGAGPRRVSQVLDCSTQEATAAFERYWETYKGLRDFMQSCHDKVDRREAIVTPFGRERHFPPVFDKHWGRARAHRQAANFMIQSTGGDLTSRAFYLTAEELRTRGWGYGWLTVHDEILIQARPGVAEQARALLVSYMELVGREINLTVPLKAQSSGAALRWED